MEDAVRALAPGKRFGTILVEGGFLEPKQLVKGVIDQTRDIILHAFEWDSGDYRLEEGAAPGESITLNISTPQLILEGISRIEAWRRVERGCGTLESRWAVQAGTDALLRGLPRPLSDMWLEVVPKNLADARSAGWSARLVV